MRYDKKIYMCTRQQTYDPATGDYTEADPVETLKFASVMDTRTETMRLVYGEIRQGSLTIQLQNVYSDPFDYIRIGKKKYAVDYRRNLRTKQTFIVSEVQ